MVCQTINKTDQSVTFVEGWSLFWRTARDVSTIARNPHACRDYASFRHSQSSFSAQCPSIPLVAAYRCWTTTVVDLGIADRTGLSLGRLFWSALAGTFLHP